MEFTVGKEFIVVKEFMVHKSTQNSIGEIEFEWQHWEKYT